MAFVLKMYDGTTTVNFMDQSYLLANGGLEFSAPKKKQIWGGNSLYANGAQLIANTWENREIKIKFQVTGTTRDLLADNITAIERMLQAARTRSIEQIGAYVELQYQWDGASRVSYFIVIDGTLTWPKDVMSVEQVHQTTASGRYVIYDFELALTCAPFMSPISLVNPVYTSIPLTNGNGTNVTSGLKVYNHDDTGTGHDNWVEIDGSNIDGEVPARAILYLVGDSGESEKTKKIYIGVRKGYKSFRHILEDNAYSYRIGSNSPTSDPDYSSGGTWLALPYTGNTEQTLIRWALSDADMAATQGPFRFFGRCKDGSHWSNQANYRIRVLYGTDSIYESEWRKPVDTTTELLDLGTTYMPPWLIGDSTNLAGLNVEIQAKGDAVDTSFTINLDYVELMPQDGGYRVLEYRASGLTQLETLVDDGWYEAVYHLTSSSKRIGTPFGLMPQVELAPGVTNRIYFLQEGTAKNCEITRQLKVYVYLMPQFNVLA